MAAKGGSCPVCGKAVVAEFRPFCSRRCADVDLNRWLSGVYRIKSEEAPAEAESEASPPPKAED